MSWNRILTPIGCCALVFGLGCGEQSTLETRARTGEPASRFLEVRDAMFTVMCPTSDRIEVEDLSVVVFSDRFCGFGSAETSGVFLICREDELRNHAMVWDHRDFLTPGSRVHGEGFHLQADRGSEGLLKIESAVVLANPDLEAPVGGGGFYRFPLREDVNVYHCPVGEQTFTLLQRDFQGGDVLASCAGEAGSPGLAPGQADEGLGWPPKP